MSDKFSRPDDSAEGMPPYPPQQGQGSQGKLVLGSFQQQPPQAPRQPYPQQPNGGPPYPQQPDPRQPYPPQAGGRPPYPPQAGGRPPYPPQQQNPGYGPPHNNQQQGYVPQAAPSAYPFQQGGQYSGTGKPRKKRNKRKIGCLAVLIILLVVGVAGFFTTQRVLAFGSAISTQAPLSTQTGYMTTGNRTNFMILGYGGGDHDGANLTDSIMVASMIPSTQHTSLISVPRDLWVQNPEGSGDYSKINAVYETASNNGQNPVAGGNAIAAKVSLVTGLNVKYWMTINFSGFEDFINSIGGVNVDVPDAFNACYPANNDSSVNASWIKVQFNKGEQHMNGATAIEYARAREPLEVCGMGTSMNEAELTDFGRSLRQQIIVKAALGKMRSITTWPNFLNALNSLQKTIYTNMSLADLGLFADKMNLNDPHTARIGLSTANVMAISTASDGESIVIPQGNNWQLIPTYIQSQLYK
jgi:polyisoprenyl-teichoic acid--peptidoglycan teichoic acid transferase